MPPNTSVRVVGAWINLTNNQVVADGDLVHALCGSYPSRRCRQCFLMKLEEFKQIRHTDNHNMETRNKSKQKIEMVRQCELSIHFSTLWEVAFRMMYGGPRWRTPIV